MVVLVLGERSTESDDPTDEVVIRPVAIVLDEDSTKNGGSLDPTGEDVIWLATVAVDTLEMECVPELLLLIINDSDTAAPWPKKWRVPIEPLVIDGSLVGKC